MLASTISDIASLWVLALVVAVSFVLLLFRTELRQAIREGRLRLRHKNIEIDTAARAIDGPGHQGVPSTAPAEDIPREDPDSDREEAIEEATEEAVPEAKPSLTRVITSVRQGDQTTAHETFKALQEQEDDATERLRNEASYAAVRAMWGHDTAAVTELERLAEREEIAPLVHRLRGVVFSHAGVFDAALSAYKASAAVARDDDDRAEAAAGAARALESLGRHEAAVAEIEAMLPSVATDQAKAVLFEALADLFQAAEDWESRAAALEAVGALRPTDANVRFRIGYSYTRADRQELALLHYDASLALREDQFSLNNAGVAYEHLNMPIRAMRSYEASWQRGHTLAAANLALRLMKAGFEEQAKSLLSEASKHPEPHPHVAQRTAELADLDEDEGSRKRELLVQARSHSLFFRCFAIAKWSKRELRSHDLAGSWTFEGGTDAAAVVTNGDSPSVTITWNRNNVTMRVVGPIHNHAFDLTHEALEQPISGAERRWTRKGRAYGYFDEDDSELAVLLLAPPPGEVLRLVRPAESGRP